LQKVILDTYEFSVGWLTRALNAETLGTDRRGKMPGSWRKTDEINIKAVRENFLNFPACESHYIRARHTPGRKYLSPQLDIRKMYSLYEENEKKITNPMFWNGFAGKYLTLNLT